MGLRWRSGKKDHSLELILQVSTPQILIGYLGNPILQNDAIGFHVGQRLHLRFAARERVSVSEVVGSPMHLVELLKTYDTVILVDAVVTDAAKTGTIIEFNREELLAQQASFYPHGMNIPEVIALGQRLGLACTEDVILIGIAVPGTFAFGEGMDRRLENRIEGISRDVGDRIEAKIGK